MSDHPRGPQKIRPVFGYEGVYEVDNYGNVYSLKRGKTLLLKPQIYETNGKRYAYVNLYRKGKFKGSSIHRIVAKAFLGYEDKTLEVNHKDNNSLNNCIDNLEWVTKQYNMEYSFSKNYKAISPEGILTEIFNMERFCKDNNLDSSNMSKVAKGIRKQHRGWTTAP